METRDDRHVGDQMIRGSAWMVAMRFALRFSGLLSMTVVARLLAPADFGVFAVASAMVGFVAVFTNLGTELALIRHPNPRAEHYNTAWTYNVLVCSGAAAVIFLLAPLAVHFYGDVRYTAVVYVLATATLIGGFQNVGVADFRRQMRFHKDFQFNVFVQLAGVFTTVTAALLLRSYWALVLGILVRNMAAVALSYIMHPLRPRLSLAAHSEMVGFSFWTMVQSVALFGLGRGDRLLLGAFFGASVIGWYAIASDLAIMAVYELLHPIGRALLPGLAMKLGDADWERRNLKKIFNVAGTLSLATGLGVAVLSEPILVSLYGHQFAPAAALLTIQAAAAALGGFGQPIGQILVAMGRNRELALLTAGQALAKLGLFYWLCLREVDITVLALAGAGLSGLELLRIMYLIRLINHVATRDIFFALLRPSLAGAVMVLMLWEWQRSVVMPPVVTLLVCIPLGAAVFAVTLYAGWRLLGRPPGIEQEVLRRMPRLSTSPG